MLAVIFDKINYSDTVPKFSVVGFEGEFQGSLLAGLTFNKDIPLL